MASARWLSVGDAAHRLGVPMQAVIGLASTKQIAARLSCGAWEIDARALAGRLRVPEAVFQEPTYADLEDAMSAYLCAEEPETPTYRGGPVLDAQTEYEYDREKLT